MFPHHFYPDSNSDSLYASDFLPLEFLPGVAIILTKKVRLSFSNKLLMVQDFEHENQIHYPFEDFIVIHCMLLQQYSKLLIGPIRYALVFV